MRTNFVLIALAYFVFGLHALVQPQTAADVTIMELMTKKDQYDGKVVSVTGVIAQYSERSSPEPYSIFALFDPEAKRAVPVWASGQKGLKKGAKVKVTGTFHKKLTRPGQRGTMIDAQEITPAE